jgi:hypothetical protein
MVESSGGRGKRVTGAPQPGPEGRAERPPISVHRTIGQLESSYQLPRSKNPVAIHEKPGEEGGNGIRGKWRRLTTARKKRSRLSWIKETALFIL